MKAKELIKVGKYNSKFNEILGLDIKNFEIYRSKGLPAHMIKRNHSNCLKYIDYIPDIILKPDYIGVNPNEQRMSIELINSNFAHRFYLCTLKIQYLAVIQLSKFCCYAA